MYVRQVLVNVAKGSKGTMYNININDTILRVFIKGNVYYLEFGEGVLIQ